MREWSPIKWSGQGISQPIKIPSIFLTTFTHLSLSLSDSQCHYHSLFKALFIDLSCCYKSFLCSLSLSVISFSLSLLYLTNNCWSNFLSLYYSLCSWFLVSLSLFSSREYLLVSLVGWLSNETRFERLWYLSTKSLPHTSLKTVRIVAQ